MTIFPITIALMFFVFVSGIAVISLSRIARKPSAITLHSMILVLHFTIGILFRNDPILLTLNLIASITTSFCVAFFLPKIGGNNMNAEFSAFFRSMNMDSKTKRLILMSFSTGAISSILILSIVYLVHRIFAT